jgi:eukaryotic-like serine/threonine-protein kinase
MTLDCPRCRRVLEYSGERPSFCAYCGHSLSVAAAPAVATAREAETVAHTPRPHDTPTLGYAPAGAAAEEPGRVAGYRLIRPLGKGGMGTVYEAEDDAVGRRVALKLVAPEFVASADAVERFRQEGRLASAIAHPRCVFVIAADEEAGRPYIVMELMPGSTLQDLVQGRGPLPVGEAVAKILDVIEGLHEAHRLGVLHRDVKPSNCFLEGDGRVKVGDFGLSRSLVSDSGLTRTGAFLGTPLYASPEQIKGEKVDPRADVYSVSATLYYLLTGRAPHQGGDAAATLARIVSEPAPPPRSVRPEIPAALERVVLKGLERNRDRRWHDLDALRDALQPFVPGRLTIAGIGRRVAAYVLDVHVSKALVLLLINAAARTAAAIAHRPHNPPVQGNVREIAVMDLAIWVVFYGLIEGIWGCSPGKWLMRLRVRDEGGGKAGFGAMLLRTAIFGAVFFVPAALLVLYDTLTGVDLPLAWMSPLLKLLCVLALAAPMRPGNGYRGLHELASGTRVVRMPWSVRRRPRRSRPEAPPAELETSRPDGMPERVGPYVIRGALTWSEGRKRLVGSDPGLGRAVWIELGPGPQPAAGPPRRALDRPARLRWLNGGSLDGLGWDAYVAPQGRPLHELVAGGRGLPWHDVQPLLEQLADESAEACGDGTLPAELTPETVWYQPGGRLQIVDTGQPDAPATDPRQDEARALTALGRVAALALEGRPRPSGHETGPIRAPVPHHARKILDRLTGPARPYEGIEAVRDDLHEVRGRRAEFSLASRLGRIGFLWASYFGALVLSLSLVFCVRTLAYWDLVHGHPMDDRVWEEKVFVISPLELALVPLILWPALAFLGLGFAPRLLGAALVRSDGLRPSRLRRAWRELLIWLPYAAVFFAESWLVALLPLLWALADAAHELFFPGRMLHDRLAGTRWVPR